MYGLDGRKLLLTGGATGIGRRIATRLAEEGCDVGIIDVNMGEAEVTAGLVSGAGRRCTLYRANVGDFDEVSAAVDAFLRDHGHIDILANNAGVITLGRVEEIPVAEWRRVFNVNIEGVFNLCKAVVPHLRARKSGRIINTASWFGKIGKPNYSAYSASKFAVIGLTQSLAMELAPLGINVNAVCPGTIVETGMRDEADRRSIEQGLSTAKQRESQIPMGHVGLPDDVARVVAFLASDESAYMTGQAINVTGGLCMH
jgi:meso-butanediol dehydrogenase / (S,S)-butanediol dehydrogenase / diacetyl reductase